MSCHFYKLRRIERMKKIKKALEQAETTTISKKETVEQTVEQSQEVEQTVEQKSKKTSKK